MHETTWLTVSVS